MRQRGMSEEDVAFKRALENMRYSRCTVADVDLLRSRVCRPSLGDDQLEDQRFHDVSIITARNAHRDAINEFRAQEFANRTGQTLTSFVSVDTWGQVKDNSSIRRAQRQYADIVDPVRASNTVGPNMQRVLWGLPPTLTEHHAGVLRLCRGMPILLKYNEATELCVTNGAEATVVDWHAHTIPGDWYVLDVLFVRLTNPPRPLQLPGLPPNVVPLTRTKKTVKCMLPVDDLLVSISREQVMVLPNFAMTDYASQGRTRVNNVVHLTHCKNHQSIYTCLSRSSSLQGTLLLDGFDASKIRGGASSALRQEFRELELLDDITRLRDEGLLPETVCGSSRRELLKSFVAWKGKKYVPPHVHPALDWANAADDGLPATVDTQPAMDALFYRKGDKLPQSDPGSTVAGISVATARPKRTQNVGDWSPRAKKRVRDEAAYDVDRPPAVVSSVYEVVRRGLIWDSEDWSCAYDAILTVLMNLFVDLGQDWMNRVAPDNTYMDILRARIPSCCSGAESPEALRDTFRDVLHVIHPQRFLRRGRVLTAVSDILACLFYCPINFGQSRIRCRFCSCESTHVVDVSRSYAWYLTLDAIRSCFPNHNSISSQDYVDCVLNSGIQVHCTTCRTMNYVSTILSVAPPLISIESIQGVRLRPLSTISLEVNGEPKLWRLAGAIYLGFSHFTCRYLSTDGQMWYHDGNVTKDRCIRESGQSTSSSVMETSRSSVATHYFYILSD
ncbi:hypothetical protein FKP32DRAFT_1580415 [Trametes sanguinea]|nr:hypothetical protein FKP32DRAFT_1580415 [Trametes sanguinea]